MKLLGWMHRKITQNSIESVKNFTIGTCSCVLEDLCIILQQPIGSSCSCISAQYYTEPNYKNSTCLSPPKRECKKSGGELKTNKAEVINEEPSIMIPELFPGFLAIGTLGTEALITEPTTPTFPKSFENATDGEKQLTEIELNLINDELEKFLEAEAKEVNSVSSERSSHVSIITLSGKQIEGEDTEEYEIMAVCPLQEYLFGSSIELPKKSEDAKKEKVSLGELFKRSTFAYEDSVGKCDPGKKQRNGKKATHFMKNMLKKLHSSKMCKGSASHDATESGSTKRKLPKVLRKFHKKIHPEKSTADKEFIKAQKFETKDTSYDDGYHNGDPAFNKDNSKFHHTAMIKKESNIMNQSHNMLSSSDSAGNREYWIKADANYLVLELSRQK